LESPEIIGKLVKADLTNRRLDSLSKLLARGSGSTCVAVSIIDGKLVVAANDFFSGTKDGEGQNVKVDNIRKILSHFKRVIDKTQISEEERKETFNLICSVDKPSITETPYSVQLGNEKFQKVIEDVVSGKPVTSEMYRKEFGKAWKIAWDAYGHFSDLLRKFNKVEIWLQNEQKPPNILLTSEDPAQNSILMREAEDGVHAEMQILSEITQHQQDSKNKQTKGFYIGISKLCCLHCDRVLQAANEVFLENDLPKVSYKGAHELSFEKGWKTPLLLYTKENFRHVFGAEKDIGLGILFDALAEKINAVIEDIAAQAEKERRKRKKGDTKEFTFQSATPSGSEGGSPIPMGIEIHEEIPAYILLNLREEIKEINKLSETEVDEALSIMLNLIKIKAFSDLLQTAPLETDDAIITFNSILASMQENDPYFPEVKLSNIMQNEELVGKKIAEHFHKMNTEGQTLSQDDRQETNKGNKGEESPAYTPPLASQLSSLKKALQPPDLRQLDTGTGEKLAKSQLPQQALEADLSRKKDEKERAEAEQVQMVLEISKKEAERKAKGGSSSSNPMSDS